MWQPKYKHLQCNQYTQESVHMVENGAERVSEPDDKELCFEIAPSTYASSMYDREAAPMKLQYCGLNKT